MEMTVGTAIEKMDFQTGCVLKSFSYSIQRPSSSQIPDCVVV